MTIVCVWKFKRAITNKLTLTITEEVASFLADD